MRNAPNLKAERCRVSGPPNTNCGAFAIEQVGKPPLLIVVGNGYGWDHVSISTRTRCPDYAEMCLAKDLFFRDDECVMQLAVPAAEHVNMHEHCLHWWRGQTREEMAEIRREWESAGEECPWPDVPPPPIPRPPAILVGVKGIKLV